MTKLTGNNEIVVITKEFTTDGQIEFYQYRIWKNTTHVRSFKSLKLNTSDAFLGCVNPEIQLGCII